MPLHNRTVLITGSSRGIGKAITSQLLINGAKVIGTSRTAEPPAEFNETGDYQHNKLDLADITQLNQFLEKLDDGKWPDVVINNAGISIDVNLTEYHTEWEKVWNKTLQVNLTSPASICKRAIHNWLKNHQKGIIINIASRAAYRGDTPEFAAYAASKGGLVSFTKSISRNMGKRGIVAYSIAPGFVETDMAKQSVTVYGEDYLKEGLAFDQLTQPADIAEIVIFLASGKGRHMTGSTFHINGGSYLN